MTEVAGPAASPQGVVTRASIENFPVTRHFYPTPSMAMPLSEMEDHKDLASLREQLVPSEATLAPPKARKGENKVIAKSICRKLGRKVYPNPSADSTDSELLGPRGVHCY